MKLGIISDVHANLPAMKKVLEHMESQGVDKKVSLGDTVGYGPFPNECIDLTVENFNYILQGNHDNACYDKDEQIGMTPLAKQAIEWTEKQVTPSNKEILRNLEYGYVTEEKIMFVHGSPRAPFAYLQTEVDALNAFLNPVEDFEVAFVGHTHVPGVWQETNKSGAKYFRPAYNHTADQESEWKYVIDDCRTIINVGAIGQPRDGDIRLSYVTYDTESKTVSFFRIPYSTDKTIAKMQQMRFSTDSWLRLMYGQ